VFFFFFLVNRSIWVFLFTDLYQKRSKKYIFAHFKKFQLKEWMV